MTDDLRIGVIGLGLRASIADAAHRPGRGSVVAAVADTDPAVRAGVPDRYEGATAFDDYHRLLDDPTLDAVIVATPDDTHEAIACDALSAGKAAFVEKPLGITTEQCDEILRTAYKTGTRLYVGHNMRHMGVVRTMRELIARGDIGEPKTVWVRHFVSYGGDYYFKDWHADRRRTTGLLLQKAAHDIDVVHWLAGGYTSRVNALGDLMVYGDLPRRAPDTPRPDGWLKEFDWPPTARKDLHHVVDVEDVSVMNMRLDNGVIAAYQQCHFSPDYFRNYTVIGTEGRLENFGDRPGDEIRVWNTGPSAYRSDADAVHRVPAADGSHGGADGRIIEEFCRFVREGGVTDTSPVAARMSVAAGELATRSLRDGGTPYDVPALDADLVRYFDAGQTRA
ncbi:Gfo/Idh/MocA family oxidoreductase [Streptomyces sp. YC504]|uniref:Gfo/Idh/MocA family oxidoreductase n=1 Tax=Streptomyces mesophilus TaxID=1775132 RepID=A0A6G4XEZ2_9ACTN|nr:Gfo/Idh/MocA family oxidoreductase [Streptomyces mesophilus]NGO75407.1 Gfo/Idh/MocA family oxidoreductase [Streptomyces mesophilus]